MKKSYRYHDMNWVEPAVTILGGIAATAKAMHVTQETVKRWLTEGRVNHNGQATRLADKAKIAFELIRHGPHLTI
jgi:hypothetical protein